VRLDLRWWKRGAKASRTLRARVPRLVRSARGRGPRGRNRQCPTALRGKGLRLAGKVRRTAPAGSGPADENARPPLRRWLLRDPRPESTRLHAVAGYSASFSANLRPAGDEHNLAVRRVRDDQPQQSRVHSLRANLTRRSTVATDCHRSCHRRHQAHRCPIRPTAINREPVPETEWEHVEEEIGYHVTPIPGGCLVSLGPRLRR